MELPTSCKPIGCKWVYKTNKDSQGRIERFKACKTRENSNFLKKGKMVISAENPEFF